MNIKRILITIHFLVLISVVSAQNTFKTIVRDSATHETLIGVSIGILGTPVSATTDDKGIAELQNIPDGKQNIVFYLIGYKKVIATIDFPASSGGTKTIELAAEGRDLEEVIVSSSRTNSRIDDLPIKVEVLGQEDMDEESTIVPGNVSSILGDLSIITIQRTGAVNGNEAIRMQGLDAKYTQIMRDGLPLYGGFSGSLGVLAIPPLDLKQVEIIKGSASTLYGGGAIGGLINFISKTPADTMQAVVTLNGTSLGEGNFNAFTSGKIKKTGFTLFGGANVKQAVDINGDGFAEVPNDKNYLIHPRLFFDINPQTHLIIGASSNYDERKGGDIVAVDNGANAQHTFLQQEKTFRNTVDLSFTKESKNDNVLTVKAAGSSFQRNLNYSGFVFNGTQYSSYTELSDVKKLNKHTVVGGINFISESFVLSQSDAIYFENYTNYTAGIFLQDDWQVAKKLSIQLGIRYDYHFTFGSFLLPRISFLYKPTAKLTFRLAGGTGYKTPNMFDITEPSPLIHPVNSSIKSENSAGINADISYHTVLFDALNIQLDQAFYYTDITHPIISSIDTAGNIEAANGNFKVNSYGTDTYLRLKLDEVELYLGYNHTESVQHHDTIDYNMPFNPKDKFSTTLAYEIERKWRMGVEAAYTANQYIYNNKKVHDFWFMALMIEKKFKFGSVVLNCENVLNNKQSNYETLYEGSKQNPVFKPVWTSLEGRVINLCIKWTL